MLRNGRLGALGLLGIWLSVQPVGAAGPQPSAATRPILSGIESALHAGTAFREVAIAPDGHRVAWVEALLDAEGRPSGKMALRTAALAATSEGAAPTPTTIDLPGDGASSPAFSPDGRRLAFLADDGRTPQLQVWLADLSASTTAGKKRGAPASALRRLTSFSGQLADLRWLPDGLGLTALAIEGRMEAAGPLAAHPRDVGVVGEHLDVQRIARFDAATGARGWVSPADLFVYEYDASPDGSAFVATAAHGEGDAKWWVAQLWRFDADQPAGRVLYTPKFQMSMPRWSPDGHNVAWLEGLMSDLGSTGGDVWTLPVDASPAGPGAEGGNRPTARCVTPGLAASPAWLAWSGADRLLWVENVAGSTGVSTVDLSTGRIESRWRAAESLSLGGSPGLALAADGKTSATIRHSFEKPPEIWAGEIGAWRQITKRNAEIHPLWGEAKDLKWTSDGLEIQGWLLAPAHPQAGKRQPLVVLVHGGPSAAHRPGWPTMAGVLAEAGFYVLLPNPRGSFGRGAAFQAANVKDFGYGDFRDIERGIDAAVANAPKEAPINPARVGIFGWSYGGYMVMWAVAKSDRFAAAVAGAGIVNWQSYAGQNRIDDWLVPFFGATVEEDPWIYARSSPITFIAHAKTPTLVLHGERDSEVPAPQGYEFWKALRRLGVPTELYIFADQGHRLNPAGERERYARTVDWFRRWLAEPAETQAVVNK